MQPRTLSSPDSPMGKIITSLTVINRVDQANTEDGLLPSDKIRSVTLNNVLVDSAS